jgi:hypothetical protein
MYTNFEKDPMKTVGDSILRNCLRRRHRTKSDGNRSTDFRSSEPKKVENGLDALKSWYAFSDRIIFLWATGHVAIMKPILPDHLLVAPKTKWWTHFFPKKHGTHIALMLYNHNEPDMRDNACQRFIVKHETDRNDVVTRYSF